ncbi:MAG: tail fiber domain-containing protein, partial [Candidatus Moraniibacteriota bacterium]
AKIQAAYTSNNHVGLAFSGYNTGLSEMMRIIDGNVGIGTTGPGYPLHVVGNEYVNGWRLGVTGSALTWNIGSDVKYIGTNYGAAINNETDGRMAFYTAPSGTAGNAATLTERLTILNSGNVGIGTTVPGAKLDIKGGADLAGSGLRLTYSQLATYYWDIHRDNLISGTGDLLFDNAEGGSATSRVVFKGNGNVGIGTTSPLYKLDVKSTGTDIARFQSDNSTGCAISVGGVIACSSDENLKKNISGIEYGLTTLLSLRPVEYNWKSENNSVTKSLGFIAQEVEQIIPKLVTTNSDGLKQLNTIGLVPVAIKAIQEQQLQISGLTNNQNKIVNQLTGQLADQTLSVDNKLQLIGASLDELTTKQIEKLKDQIASQTKDISDLKTQMADIQTNMYLERYDELWSFYENFELAKVPLKNALENVFEGKITASDIEALSTIKAKTISADSISLTDAKTSGRGVIEAGKTEIIINTIYVDSASKIYITSQGTTFGKNLYFDEIVDGQSFKVKIDAPALEKDIKFNWLIVK